jgi:hypothetical protein
MQTFNRRQLIQTLCSYAALSTMPALAQEFTAFTKSELNKWARVVKQSGAKVD